MPSCLKSNSVAQRKISEVALQQLCGPEERIKNPELVTAEREFGRLHKSEDPFRAVRRLLNMIHRDLAALTAVFLKRSRTKPEADGILQKYIEGFYLGALNLKP